MHFSCIKFATIVGPVEKYKSWAEFPGTMLSYFQMMKWTQKFLGAPTTSLKASPEYLEPKSQSAIEKTAPRKKFQFDILESSRFFVFLWNTEWNLFAHQRLLFERMFFIRARKTENIFKFVIQ